MSPLPSGTSIELGDAAQLSRLKVLPQIGLQPFPGLRRCIFVGLREHTKIGGLVVTFSISSHKPHLRGCIFAKVCGLVVTLFLFNARVTTNYLSFWTPS